MQPQRFHETLPGLAVLLCVAGCGGGSPEPGAEPSASITGLATADAVRQTAGASNPPSDAQRVAAATATAQSTTNDCAPARPFYWEVGTASAAVTGGSVLSSSTPLKITAALPMSIASASKWVYGSYVVQKQNGVLSASDIKFLTFRSGYTQFTGCNSTQTVDSCLATGTNGSHSATTDGAFFYNGGHMQKHASSIGLGALDDAGLANEMKRVLGSDLPFIYVQPQLAGGIVASAAGYAVFLRKLLNGQLQMNALLGSNTVCTNPATCGIQQAIYTPSPPGESWHYSIGHWVEDDPNVGDGAFSSPGAFGFYPWIDAGKAYYGVLARSVPNGAWGSVYCGREIRKAWATGVAQ